MATTLYFLNATTEWNNGVKNTDLAGAASGWMTYALSTSRGGGVINLSRSTVSGPTNGLEIISTWPMEWLSPPLAADVTISGSITWNLRALESNMSANVAINAVLEVIDGATGSITLIDQTARTTELGTTEAAANFAETPAAGVACKRGDRLRARVFGGDAGTMVSGYTFSFYFAGTTAAASGDSYFTLTENLTFDTAAPSGTTVYLTDTASDVATASVDREAWTSRGASTQNDATATLNGPIAPIHTTDTSGGTVVDWFTKPLQAFTLGGPVAVRFWAAESSTAANAAVLIEIARVDSDGTNPVVWGFSGNVVELSIGSVGYDVIVSGDDLAISDGQRLRLRLYADVARRLSGDLVALHTVTTYYAASSGGVSGDTYFTFSNTLAEYSLTPVRPGWAALHVIRQAVNRGSTY